ncbi:DivIVA domain-containing protein [Goekera deserti]|uniref:DivIVA domain-containing protein n=1 Tax=Goekera deserti TaxID=2497753 RepID=UPI0018780A95|nr:DivIVA domain-containing protein [Goekera deserti]
MVTFVFFVLGLVLVGGLLFAGASLLLGRGETQPPQELDRSPVELPGDRPVVADDLRRLRISVAVRGYRMTEVDWLIEQLATALDERDRELAALRGTPAGPDDELPTGPSAQELDDADPPADGDPTAGAGAGAGAGALTGHATRVPAGPAGTGAHAAGRSEASAADDGHRTDPVPGSEELPRA